MGTTTRVNRRIEPVTGRENGGRQSRYLPLMAGDLPGGLSSRRVDAFFFFGCLVDLSFILRFFLFGATTSGLSS